MPLRADNRRPRPAALAAGVVGIAALLGTLGLTRHARPVSISDAPAVDFARDIRPILSNNCFLCHGPDPSSREASLRLDTREGLFTARNEKSDAPVVPGDRAASPLWQRITTTSADDHMPPLDSGKSLTPAQLNTIGRWIDAGAPWKNHWSFEPPLEHTPPAVQDESWPASDIDRFVLARLESEGLTPSPRADRPTLLRRVSLDLTGLPPTPEEVEAFVTDNAPDAFERVVDRLLASPRFGERWARVWLDQARYADTKGYEADRSRTIWPYRDWVIRAFNDDMPFDEFAIKQLAGDLLPDATDDDLLATAFHRNTMNNDEGGTDDEEYRVAAVKDRVATTFQVFSGLTMACAECHTHKYDPLTQTEYYEAFAFFNQSADADRPDESPTHAFGTQDQQARLDALRAEAAALESRLESAIDAALATPLEPDASTLASMGDATFSEPVDIYWIDDDTPAGVTLMADGAPSPWRWIASDEHPSAVGGRALLRSGPAFTPLYFDTAPIPIQLHDGDRLVMHVWLDEADPPAEIMLQIHTVASGWAHRAYWGQNLIAFGQDGTGARRNLGPLPARGQWVRLEIDPAQLDLAPGAQIDGLALSQHAGTVRWDGIGLVSKHLPDTRWKQSFGAWRELMRAQDARGLPEPIAAALGAESPTPEQLDTLRRHYAQHFHAPTRALTRPLTETIAAARADESRVRAAMPTVPIMAELAPDARRTTHLLSGGSYLSPDAEVSPGVPEALHPFPSDLPRDRLGFATWLASPDNPLTARVTVNRFWERFFGRGIVETLEDFGAQGAAPTHPELLDHLALIFIEDGWSVKELCRRIVLSETYRQASDASPELLERDPHNALFSRGPRFRVEAEMVRDQALAVAGLLSPKMYGPPVYPPQPDGIWQVVYSGERWMTSQGEDRYRRSLYTFLRRTSPYPSMTTFDAGSREVCLPRRIRTNTPLQAFVTLNDPVYVEAAQALARRMINEGGPIASDRVSRGVRLCLLREPTREETEVLLDLVADAYMHYRDHAAEAQTFATDPLGPLPDGLDPAEAAAWTVAANVLLNLDEFLTRK